MLELQVAIFWLIHWLITRNVSSSCNRCSVVVVITGMSSTLRRSNSSSVTHRDVIAGSRGLCAVLLGCNWSWLKVWNAARLNTAIARSFSIHFASRPGARGPERPRGSQSAALITGLVADDGRRKASPDICPHAPASLGPQTSALPRKSLSQTSAPAV